MGCRAPADVEAKPDVVTVQTSLKVNISWNPAPRTFTVKPRTSRLDCVSSTLLRRGAVRRQQEGLVETAQRSHWEATSACARGQRVSACWLHHHAPAGQFTVQHMVRVKVSQRCGNLLQEKSERRAMESVLQGVDCQSRWRTGGPGPHACAFEVPPRRQGSRGVLHTGGLGNAHRNSLHTEQRAVRTFAVSSTARRFGGLSRLGCWRSQPRSMASLIVPRLQYCGDREGGTREERGVRAAGSRSPGWVWGSRPGGKLRTGPLPAAPAKPRCRACRGGCHPRAALEARHAKHLPPAARRVAQRRRPPQARQCRPPQQRHGSVPGTERCCLTSTCRAAMYVCTMWSCRKSLLQGRRGREGGGQGPAGFGPT